MTESVSANTAGAGDVLDAACGTGIDAAVLARRGFHVRAADGSRAMVEVAAARFRREGLAIAVQRCSWADLPAVAPCREGPCGHGGRYQRRGGLLS